MTSADETARSVLLVAYDGSPMSEAQLHLACRAANDIDALVRVLHVVERPWQIPLTQILPHEQEIVDAHRARVTAIADTYKVQSEVVIAHAHAVGEAIIAEAQECEALQIFIGLRDRNRPTISLVLSKTLRYVLQHARCSVQIGYLPAGVPEPLAPGAASPVLDLPLPAHTLRIPDHGRS